MKAEALPKKEHRCSNYGLGQDDIRVERLRQQLEISRIEQFALIGFIKSANSIGMTLSMREMVKLYTPYFRMYEALKRLEG